ncbi:MAG: hypothetical protein EBX39_09020, partial [Actinobacteria bacterium]|nr:hypothetical protein [Actinomycetota bacterium]
MKTIYGYHLILVTARGELTFDDVKEQIATSLKNDLRSLLDAELARVAQTVSVGVDGRYGRFVATTGTITVPAVIPELVTVIVAVEPKVALLPIATVAVAALEVVLVTTMEVTRFTVFT